MSQVKLIAQFLNLSEEDAHEYCHKIQKSLKYSPSYENIYNCLKAISNKKISPEEVAKLLPLGGKKSKGPNHIKNLGTNSNQNDFMNTSPIFNHDPRHFTDDFEKCPHGVPKMQTCGICDPERFRFETGVD